MKFKKILVLYKRSAYRTYFLENKNSLRKTQSSFLKEEKKRFELAHDQHYNGLKLVSKILLTNGIRFSEAYRGTNVNYADYDLILTVGGDGTFLEAARNLKHQVIMGINSAPDFSIGRYCVIHANDFEKYFKLMLHNKFRIDYLQRLRLQLDNHVQDFEALNDILLCHSNPAFLCRYYLGIGKYREEQRSSGIWISTAAGSTGAIYSAGGKVLKEFSKDYQYFCRELYKGKNKEYKLRKGVLKSDKTIKVTSLMRSGMIYLDGAHKHYHFEYGCNAKISISPHPIKTIRF